MPWPAQDISQLFCSNQLQGSFNSISCKAAPHTCLSNVACWPHILMQPDLDTDNSLPLWWS